MDKKKVLHIITNLESGGAEIMLYRLLKHSGFFGRHSCVITLISSGQVGEKIRDLGIPVFEIGMTRGRCSLKEFLRLVRLIKKNGSPFVQTWMYHADLVGGLAAKLAGCRRIIWGIHHSNLNYCDNNLSTIIAAKICSFLSWIIPDKIIACAHFAKTVHKEIGYKADLIEVIPNGFDTNFFKPDESARSRLIADLDLPSNANIVCLAGRFNPQKDHHTFLMATAIILKKIPNTFFLLCGNEIEATNGKLMGWIRELGVGENVLLLGPRNDIARIFAASDVAVSSSIGEGFPNVVGEAMSCGTPCVVTDVGDSAFMVGMTGFVVPPSNPQLLAAAIEKMLNLEDVERKRLGLLARKRVCELFGIENVVEMYEKLY